MQTSDALSDEIRELESLLHDPSIRADVARLDHLLADEFTEFGSSGRVYSKSEILVELPAQSPMAISMSHFVVRNLSPDVCLATYRARIEFEDSTTQSLRSSIWIRRSDRWQVIFHQGTVTDALAT